MVRMAKSEAYQVLGLEGVERDEEIKKAYRKMSLATHPDKNPVRFSRTARIVKAVWVAHIVYSLCLIALLCCLFDARRFSRMYRPSAEAHETCFLQRYILGILT